MQEIVFATNTLDAGGIEKAFVNLMNKFTLQNIRVKLILCSKQGIFLNQLDSRVDIIDLKCRLRTSFFKFFKTLLKLKAGTPVICAPQFVCFTLILVNFLLGNKLKIIVTHHGLDDRDVKDLGMIGRFEKKMIRWLYKYAHTVIAVSVGVRDYLMNELKVPAAKVQVIYNPVLSPEIRSLSKQTLNDDFVMQNLKQQIPLIVSVGRFGKVKRFDVLLASFAALVKELPAKLVLVGDGPERAALEADINKLGLEEHVHITGFKDNPYPYMRHASLFVSSSESESFGMVMLEALYVGTGVVATRTTGAMEVLNKGQFGKMTDSLDTPHLTAALKEALLHPPPPLDPDLDNWMRQFEITQIASQYLELLKN